MKMNFDLLIDAAADTVWDAFTDANNLQRWQPTLIAVEPRSGDPGQPESVTELVYEESGRRVVLRETVTERREGSFMAGLYESPMARSLIVNTLTPVDNNKTRWTAWHNMRFLGMARLFSIFLHGSVRRRVEDDMQRFKLMLETDLASDNP